MSNPAKGHRWPLGIPGTTVAASSRVDDARFAWLCVLSNLEPRILEELADAGTAATVDAWANRWRLDVPWIRAHAADTLREWAQFPTTRGSWADRSDTGAGWTADGTLVQGVTWYKDAAAFAWLARVHLSTATYGRLARESNVSSQTVAQACGALAALIDLPLQAARRGRPRRA